MSYLNPFKATWVSPSSIASFLNCPLAYFYQNVYKNERGKKISIVSPASSVGSLIHELIEALALLNDDQRKNKKFAPDFYRLWENITGEKGGFTSEEEENTWKEKAINILKNVKSNIHHLLGPTKFMVEDPTGLPSYWLSEEHEIRICGKCDYILDKESYWSIIDIKTGERAQDENSLQLPIYSLLADEFLREKETRAFYWEVGKSLDPYEKKLPDLKESYDRVMDIALQMKAARAEKNFKCPRGGCWSCSPLERIIKGEGTFVSFGTYGGEQFMLKKST